LNGLFYSLNLGIKSSILVFIFIWVRASFPRIRFDQLISFCWTILLPLVFAFVILIPCILYNFNIFITNVNLF
jgi:NADH-ubiquinone oxidoreductase chain 1